MTSIHYPYKPRVDDLQSAIVVQKNLEYLTEIVQNLLNTADWGSVTVPASGASISVNFRQPIVNPKVMLTPTANPGTAYWISARTSAGFTIQLAAAQAGGVPFDWIARGGT